MKLPKVIFQYSYIYDQAFSSKSQNDRNFENGFKVAVNFQKYWDKNSKRILSVMSEVSKLKWRYDKVWCYLSFFTPFSFSMPLTVKIHKNREQMLTTLVHELSHNLLIQNRDRCFMATEGKKLYKKYESETFTTRVHITVHAIVKLTLEKAFGKGAEKYLKYERMWEISKTSRLASEYKRAREIMEKEGPENVLRQVMK